jgi:hypothetical protein
MKRLSIASLLALTAAPALAHPGHDAHPATHWIADPAHLAVTLGLAALAVLVAGAVVARLRARRRDRT